VESQPVKPTVLDERLKFWASETQCRYIDAVIEHGSIREAARALQTNYTTVRGAIEAAKARAALKGFSPEHDMNKTVPDPFVVKGTSTLYDENGKPRLQWVKTSVDQQKAEAARQAALEAMAEELPRLAALPPPAVAGNENLCNCYVITDFHLGMLSHHEETGADWDVKIAERTILDWFAQAIAQAPNSKVGVFAQLSDFLHADGLEPLTPASKHVLDVDSRFQKVVRTAIRVLRTIIDMLLLKHERLHIVMADANHDPVSQVWMREWFSVLYENEPRVTVDRSPSPYNAFEFGKVALFFHHGHKRKVGNVSEVFAAQFREIFGRTRYAYAHTGHLHSIDVKENNLMVVEQHRTLAAPDAYAARGGWLSGRDAKVITYHREFGEVSRLTINSDMLKEAEPA
jgi:hypothetical protein